MSTTRNLPEDSDKKRGLYGKYIIERADGSSAPGEKHDGCMYYVLDLVHDRHALAALRAYIESCQAEYPQLAADLRHEVGAMILRGHSR